MIRPRPSIYHTAVRDNEFVVIRETNFAARPEAHCKSCGCRLSRYRPPVNSECWNCERRRIYATEPAELHPRVEHVRRDRTITCPQCGGQMHHNAKMCRGCRYNPPPAA